MGTPARLLSFNEATGRWDHSGSGNALTGPERLNTTLHTMASQYRSVSHGWSVRSFWSCFTGCLDADFAGLGRLTSYTYDKKAMRRVRRGAQRRSVGAALVDPGPGGRVRRGWNSPHSIWRRSACAMSVSGGRVVTGPKRGGRGMGGSPRIMTLSGAIKIGARLKPQARGRMFDRSAGATCALGAAADALGAWDDDLALPPSAVLKRLRELFPLLGATTGSGGETVEQAIAALNDRAGWSRERIAARVEHWERALGVAAVVAGRDGRGDRHGRDHRDRGERDDRDRTARAA